MIIAREQNALQDLHYSRRHSAGPKRNPDGQGFAAFGRVLLGMEVVRTIHQAPVEGQTLEPPVKILNIRRKV